jgi:hypothetical protein
LAVAPLATRVLIHFAMSEAEFTAKIGLVSEEADESVFWLARLTNARIRSTMDVAPLLAEAQELAKIFGASARTARSRRRRRRPDDPTPR